MNTRSRDGLKVFKIQFKAPCASRFEFVRMLASSCPLEVTFSVRLSSAQPLFFKSLTVTSGSTGLPSLVRVSFSVRPSFSGAAKITSEWVENRPATSMNFLVRALYHQASLKPSLRVSGHSSSMLDRSGLNELRTINDLPLSLAASR